MSKQKYYTTYDQNSSPRKIYMPEDDLNIFEQGGGIIDLIPFLALIGTIVAGFMFF